MEEVEFQVEIQAPEREFRGFFASAGCNWGGDRVYLECGGEMVRELDNKVPEYVRIRVYS